MLKDAARALASAQFPPGAIVVLIPDESLRGQSAASDADILRELARAIAAQRSGVAVFADWVRSALDCSDSEALEEFGSLFASYQTYCLRRGVAAKLRLGQAAFGQALSGCGLPTRRGGRRSGCRILGDAVAIEAASSSERLLREWIEANCDLGDRAAREEATPLYANYRQFCAERGMAGAEFLTQTAFGLRLNELGVLSKCNHASRKKERVGIRLRRRHSDRELSDLFASSAAP